MVLHNYKIHLHSIKPLPSEKREERRVHYYSICLLALHRLFINAETAESKARAMKNLYTPARSTQRESNSRSLRMAQSSQFNESPIALIAQDHLHSILLLLPVNSILSFATTCKRLNSLSSSDTLWEALCRRDWGTARVEAIKASPASKQQGFAWIKLYKQVSQLRSVSCHRLICSSAGDEELVPGPRASHSLNFVSDCLVLFGGGCEGGRHLDDTWVAYIDHDVKRVLTWQKVSSGMPSGRFGHTCVVVGDSLVVFGGINDHGVRQNDTWIGQLAASSSSSNNDSSDRMTLVWRTVDVGSFAPPPRGAHASCCIGDRRMLIYGGIGPNGIRIGDTWVLDLSNNYELGRWHEIVGRPSPPPRSGHTLTRASTDGSKTVVFGGRGSAYDVLNDVWLLDLADEVGDPRWERLMYDSRNITEGSCLPRVGHSATMMLGGQVLVYGGEDSRRHRKNDFWLMDPVGCCSSASASSSSSLRRRRSGSLGSNGCSSMWRRLKASSGYGPKPRSFHAACTDRSGRYLYVFGGMVDGVFEPAESYGLRFDGEFFVVELMLHL